MVRAGQIDARGRRDVGVDADVDVPVGMGMGGVALGRRLALRGGGGGGGGLRDVRRRWWWRWWRVDTEQLPRDDEGDFEEGGLLRVCVG